MYCESCGTFIPDDQAFCSNCGAKAPVILRAGTAAQSVPPVQSVEPIQPAEPARQAYQQTNAEPVFDQNILIPVTAKSVVNYTARAGLIFGIVSMVSFYIPYTNIVPAILGIIFSLMGMKKTDELGGRGNCIAGLILSGAGATLWTILIISTIVRNING